MSKFTGFSEKERSEIWAKYRQWCYRFEFLEEIRLHWLFHVSFGEIRFLKWHGVINSNSWLLAILKEFSSLPLFKRIFTKIGISCAKSYHQSARPTHLLASIWRKLWEDSICEWPLMAVQIIQIWTWKQNVGRKPCHTWI